MEPREASSAGAAIRQRRAEALVNPASGLANDYLNLFNEIVMLIEQLPNMPELIEDIQAWRPTTYKEYFSRSVLPGSASALDAYAALDAGFRQNFEQIVADLDQRAVGSVAAIRRHYRTNGDQRPDLMAALCERAGKNLREVLAQATDIVNHGAKAPRESPQQRADRLLESGVRQTG